MVRRFHGDTQVWAVVGSRVQGSGFGVSGTNGLRDAWLRQTTLDAQRRLRTFEGFPWVHIQTLPPPPVTEGHVKVLGLEICYSPYLSLRASQEVEGGLICLSLWPLWALINSDLSSILFGGILVPNIE